MRVLKIITLCTAMMMATTAMAEMPADVEGGKDHPVLSRYAGSWLMAQEVLEFDEISIPSGAKDTDLINLEGRITRLYYLAPAKRSILEVHRNYEQALDKAGATRQWSCALVQCDKRGGILDLVALRPVAKPMEIATGTLEGYNVNNVIPYIGSENMRYWVGTFNAKGRTLYVAVLNAPLVGFEDNSYVATTVMIVEPKVMETDKVTADTSAAMMNKGLQAEGRFALYGVFFDTGKAVLKPESKAQLDEMAKLLQSSPAMRVHVVGHTDNQGVLDANLTLSRQRAQAVVDALVKNHKVDAKRLSVAGVASYAPLASNADDAGRAKNRRVELVLQ